MLAHEIGHHVENDFGLTPTLRELAGAALSSAAAPRERRHQWQGLGEVFADIYGTLAASPAFGRTLADFAAAGPAGRRVGGVQAYKLVIPASSRRREPDPQAHEGYEWLYVLNGRLRLVLSEHDLELSPGEAAEFDTRVPHWFGAAELAQTWHAMRPPAGSAPGQQPVSRPTQPPESRDVSGLAILLADRAWPG